MPKKIIFYQDRGVDKEDWAVSYGDVVTLLLVFFIMLLGASTLNQGVLDGIKGGKIPIEEVENKFRECIKRQKLKEYVSIKKDITGLDIIYKNKLLFGSGEAIILPETQEKIKACIRALKLPEGYRYEIEGHTDDNPINTAQYPSNWHLSSYRALAILRIFLKEGFDPNKFTVQGFGDTRPVVPNRDERGVPIVANQIKNRRAVIKIR